MAPWLQAIILGVIQGLTEFLPVSSSGHLALMQAWLGDQFAFIEEAVAFDLVLHIGTLLPVLWYYRKELTRMIKALGEPGQTEGNWLVNHPERQLAFMVILATIPTGIMGVTLKDTFEGLFHDPRAVCAALFVTGALLLSTKFFDKNEGKTRILWTVALVIGLAQGLAITPGISRSGSTIAVALLFGIDRELAARFSFLLAIPAISGAAVLVAKDGVTIAPDLYGPLALGFLAAMLVGYLSLAMLVALVRHGGLFRFTFYLWPVAIVGWLLLGS